MSLDDALAVVQGEEPLDASTEAALAVQGYQDAMSYVLQLANDPHFTYSAALIRSLHYMMIKHTLDKNPGRWRPGHIFVRDDETQQTVYEGPSAELVPFLVDELVSALDDDGSAPPMVRAAMAHLNLVMIHPFSDGNGRMARCLQTLVLARHGTLAPQLSSIEEYLGRNVQSYYDVLASVGGGAWHPERDARPWVRYCLTAHYRQATTMLRRARLLDRIWLAAEEEALRAGVPERTVLILTDAIVGAKIRNATYRSMAEISEQVASRDLKQLVDAGLLIPHGERRGRVYMASARLAAMRTGLVEKTPIVDPFTVGSIAQLSLPSGP
ncbi:MAG: Fic family protein [Acidobacteriaceae bacterium]|nr:Fic family protein [Acidobacteriaceae bacterium]